MKGLRKNWLAIALATAVMLSVTKSDSFASETSIVPGSTWRKCGSPAELGWSAEKLRVAHAFRESIDTAALMIIQDGIIVDEWGPTALPLMCHSVRKSLLSALYGTHVAEGTIDLDQTLRQLGINDNAPSLSDTERQAKVRDLLKARSGIYHPALYETAKMAAARPSRGSHEPGSYWYYNNWDFNTACSIFENQTGRCIFEEFEKQLAIPLEMEDFSRDKHTRYVTGEDSVHPAYPFEMSARDLARVGLLYLRQGRWGNRQLIPEDWVRESTQSYSDTQESGGYGYMWWVAHDGRHFPGVSIPDRSYSARGVGGQYLLVIPDWDLVICHRVNTFESDKAVSKSDFGKLLALILDARPNRARISGETSSTSGSQSNPVE